MAFATLRSRRQGPISPPRRFLVLVYRMQQKPTANRVAVWRQLKKIGGVYLQQSVTAFPQNARVARDIKPLLARIEETGGDFHLLPLRKLPPDEEAKLVSLFLQQSARHYQEIVENCEVNFTKEIDFETFRRNFSYEEAEEIRAEYEKIVAWFHRVSDRDWFGAPNQGQATEWLERCRQLLEGFEAKVYDVQSREGGEPRAPSLPDSMSLRRTVLRSQALTQSPRRARSASRKPTS
jgi:hypothetical protein